MMSDVIDGMALFLSSPPNPLQPTAQVGDRMPSTPADLPSVVLSLAIESTRGTGMGAFRREGNQLAQNTTIVDVAASPSTFTLDLKTMRLAALPIRKNPASKNVNFSNDDVSVTRITGPNQPVAYSYSDKPSHVDEFVVDDVGGRIIFGAPQPAGGKLQVVYWTVTFRDDITGGQCNGLITLEVWGGSINDASALARSLQSKLIDRPGLRQHGFSALLPAGLNAAENINYQPASGSAFPVWKQRLIYKFQFDSEQGGETSAGGPILKVNVNMDQTLDEKFSTPAGT
jgi:hypothetical protein